MYKIQFLSICHILNKLDEDMQPAVPIAMKRRRNTNIQYDLENDAAKPPRRTKIIDIKAVFLRPSILLYKKKQYCELHSDNN